MTDEPDIPKVERRIGLGDEARQDIWTRERITVVLKASIEDRRWLRRHVRYIEFAVAVFGITIIVTTFGLVNLIQENGDRAREVRAAVQQIQTEREANIERACLDQNERHDDTIKELDLRLSLATLADPFMAATARIQIKQSRDFTVALIDALAPRRDCAAVKAQLIPSATQERP